MVDTELRHVAVDFVHQQTHRVGNAVPTGTRCRAYTYVEPGVQSTRAVCWLKDAVPEAIYNPNVTSGHVFR